MSSKHFLFYQPNNLHNENKKDISGHRGYMKFKVVRAEAPKSWKHPWQSVVLDDISINPYNFLVQIH